MAHDTSSRYSPLCREFVIKYGLLDESTKLYWDEKPVRLVRSFSQENRQRRQNQWNGNHQNQNLGNLFHKNANELIRNGSLFRQSGTAAYEMVKTAAMKGSQPDFVSSFQAYIVHLGLAISDVCTKKFHGKKIYTNVLGYICKAILHDNYIYNELFGINALGNTFKHDTGYIRADINRFLTHYNTMIDKLISVSGCPIFKKCHVYAKPFRKFRSQMRRHR